MPSPPLEASVPARSSALLLKACVGQSNEDAWSELSHRFGPKIRRRLKRACGRLGIPISHEEALELCQDLFLNLFTCKIPFSGESDNELWAYLDNTCRNLALDFARYRRARRRRGHLGAMSISLSSSSFRSYRRFSTLCTREQDPESALLAKEKLRLFKRRCSAASRPSRVCRDAVRLTLLEGWTSREASQQLEGEMSPKQIDNAVAGVCRRLQRQGLVVRRRNRDRNEPCYAHVMPPKVSVPLRSRVHRSDESIE